MSPSILSDVEKFAEFNSEIIFSNPSKNGGGIGRKLRAWATPGQTIARKLFLRHGHLELMLVVNKAL